MAISFEAAKREISSAMIEICRLRSAAHLPKLEKCKTMPELRLAIFAILEEIGRAEPERSGRLLLAWKSLGVE